MNRNDFWNSLRRLVGLMILSTMVALAALGASTASAGIEYVACDPGIDLEPFGELTSSRSTAQVFANVATTTPQSSGTGEYYQAYIRLTDNNTLHYLEVFVKRTPSDGGTYTARVAYDSGSGRQLGNSLVVSSAPNLKIRWDSGSSWSALANTTVLLSSFTLSTTNQQTRRFGAIIHP